MEKYLLSIDDAVSLDFCKSLISKFHDNPNSWIVRDDETMRFNEINLSQNQKIFDKELEVLYNVFLKCTDYYKSMFPSWQFPKSQAFEEIRMKHYPVNLGEFKPHVDASTFDNMKRFLVFFLYLDEGEGGETVLFDQEIVVKRKPGRILMFPPLWTFPHAGTMPTENDKHIVGSYLHYHN